MLSLNRYLSQTPENKRDPAVIAYLAAFSAIRGADSAIADAIENELLDQRSHLKMIASENYSSLTVQLAMGNLLTDKYAEGYPFHRFYAGCENIDTIEAIACKEACSLFNCEQSYVQPHSGADANLVAFWSILLHKLQIPYLEKLGVKGIDKLTDAEHEELRQQIVNQKLLGMSLNSGGHLTHGYRLNASSKLFKALTYEVDSKTGLLDYAAISKIAKAEKPLILLAGYSAYPRRIDFAVMKEIADSVGAVLMVDMAHFSGLVAGKVFTGVENPVPYADIVTSTTHKTLRGPRGGLILCKAEYTDAINRGCPTILGGPLPHVIAAKALAFKEANTPDFCLYSQNVVANARALAQGLIDNNIRVVTGGTDNHLVLFDVSSVGLTGRQAESALREASITVNRNAIPFDPNGPWYTSGIRIGTPALTTLGMGTREMTQIANWIAKILKNTQPAPGSQAKYKVDPEALAYVQGGVRELLHKYPLYPELPISP